MKPQTPSPKSQTKASPADVPLLRDAARWLLISRLFECPNDRWRREIAALAAEVGDPGLERAAAATGAATEGDYHSVFGPGGPAPPREVTYHASVELGSLMSELTGYYQAFGYRSALEEPPDHVAVEAGFVAYLRLKEAYAMRAGHPRQAVLARDAAERFRADHVAAIAGPLAAFLAASGIDYLVQASQALAAAAGTPPSDARLPMLQPDEDDEGSEFPCCNS